MGIFSGLAHKIRATWAKDKDALPLHLAKGATIPGLAGSSVDLMQTFGLGMMSDYMRLEQDLLSRYVDYEEMDEYPELSAAVTIFADDSTQTDTQLGKAIWVTAPDKDLQQHLNDLFHRRLRMDEEIEQIARSTCKYGSNFEELLVTQDGVVGLNHLPAPTVRRIEGLRGELFGFVQDFNGQFGYDPNSFAELLAQRSASIRTGSSFSAPEDGQDGPIALEDWEVVHFRLQTKHRRSIYGASVIESARWIWKRLMLLEDTALIYRLQRAPERFAFYIDVGNLPAREALAYVNKVRQQYKKKRIVNPATGKLDLRYDTLAPDEDFFVPVRAGTRGTEIDVLGSPQWQCLVGSTPVPLLDGTCPTIAELADRGGEFWVYSVDAGGSIVPGRGRSARVTHEAADIWEVELDSGEVIECTSNHPFLMRDGKWSLAEHLRAGDSLMPLYRNVTSHGKGEKPDGYERFQDLHTGEWVYTHHRVFEATTGTDLPQFFRGNVIHHKNFDKRDNTPDNLEGLGKKQHMQLHAAASPSWNSPERWERHRKMMVERMSDKVLRAEKAKILADWNRSEDHRARVRGKNNARWRDLSLADLEYLVLATGARGIHELMQKGRVSQRVIARVLRENNLKWNDFAAKNIPGWVPKGRAKSPNNHRVVAVRKTGRKDRVYDLTVDVHHNFAVGQGVFVSNSVEDIDYFLNKLFSALMMPRAYLQQDDSTSRGVLSSEDVRFARSVLRVQRALRDGSHKIGRVHLASKGIDPSRAPFDVHMTVPSSIYELAQLEVHNARADLAARLNEFMPLYWIYRRVFNLSDSEIEDVTRRREAQLMTDAVWQARAEAKAAKILGVEPEAPEFGEDTRKVAVKPNILWRGARGITEKELFAHRDPEAEKRAEGKLDRLLRNDAYYRRVLRQTQDLVQSLARSH